MTSRSKKRRRRLLKIAGAAALTGAGLYFGSKLFGGGSDPDSAADSGASGADAATESGGEGAITGSTTQASMFGGIPTPVLIGAGVLVLFLVMKRK